MCTHFLCNFSKWPDVWVLLVGWRCVKADWKQTMSNFVNFIKMWCDLFWKDWIYLFSFVTENDFENVSYLFDTIRCHIQVRQWKTESHCKTMYYIHHCRWLSMCMSVSESNTHHLDRLMFLNTVYFPHQLYRIVLVTLSMWCFFGRNTAILQHLVLISLSLWLTLSLDTGQTFGCCVCC